MTECNPPVEYHQPHRQDLDSKACYDPNSPPPSSIDIISSQQGKVNSLKDF